MINRKERRKIAEIIAMCVDSVEDTRSPYEILGEIEARLRRVINAGRK